MKSKIIKVEDTFGLTVVTVAGKPVNTKIGRVVLDENGNRYKIDSVPMPHYNSDKPAPNETMLVLSSVDAPPQMGANLLID